MATTPVQPTPTSAPTNKTVAATGASAFGAAIATLILFFLDKEKNLPPEVSGAITTIVTAVLTALAAYFVPPGAGEVVVRGADGKPKTARIGA